MLGLNSSGGWDFDGRPEISPNRWHWCILRTLMGDQKYHPTDDTGVFYGHWWETRNITQQMTLVYFTDIDGRPEILPNRWHWCILLTLMGDQKYHPTDCIGVFYWHWINWLIQDGRSSVTQQPFMKPYKQLKMKNEYLVSRWAELSRFEQVRNRESYFGLKGWRKRKSAYAL